MPAFNAEFMQPADEEGSAFMKWIGANLDDILCEQYERTVTADNCVSFEGKTQRWSGLFEQRKGFLSDKLLLFRLLPLSWEVLPSKLHPVSYCQGFDAAADSYTIQNNSQSPAWPH